LLYRLEVLKRFKIAFERVKNAKIVYYNNSKYFVNKKQKLAECKVA